MAVTGRIDITYERHQGGAVLEVTDEAEGMSFARATRILAYGGAHSPLSRGESRGRGYFGRGLKQAVFGLGAGALETIRDGRLNAQRICEAVPEWRSADIWFCGPAGFGRDLRRDLMAKGLPSDNFHQELFAMR